MQITIPVHVYKCAIDFHQIYHIRFVYIDVKVNLMYILTVYSGNIKYTLKTT